MQNQVGNQGVAQTRTAHRDTGNIMHDEFGEAIMARVGIYDLLIHHDQILQPVVMRHWKLDQVTDLTDEAEKAREALFERIERIGKVGAKMSGDRAAV